MERKNKQRILYNEVTENKHPTGNTGLDDFLVKLNSDMFFFT